MAVAFVIHSDELHSVRDENTAVSVYVPFDEKPVDFVCTVVEKRTHYHR